ncbi:inverse autotransporter beta domain-containing protein, partial [Candidatus Pelagibacter sp.]|nr:inverse autotransporter beta domain-containing protein [Candidatus Pelagibacter sp.]
KFIKIFLTSLCLIIASSAYADTSKIKDNFFSSIESFLDGNFEDTDFSIKSTEGLKPQIGILTFKPLNDTDDGLTFFQGSFFTHDGGDRNTLNLGLGKRILSNDESVMFGLNAFYDYEIDYDHQRASIGGEIKSSILELSTNHYFAISNEVTGKNNIKEEVADGYDLEFGAHVPYIPTAKMYAKIFEYDIPGGSDYEGVEYSSNIGIPNSGMNFEVGYKDYGNNGYDDQWFFNLTFGLSKMNPNTSFVSDQAFERVSMKDKKYEKVRRENIIVKSKAFSVKAGGL